MNYSESSYPIGIMVKIFRPIMIGTGEKYGTPEAKQMKMKTPQIASSQNQRIINIIRIKVPAFCQRRRRLTLPEICLVDEESSNICIKVAMFIFRFIISRKGVLAYGWR